jgi:uncharacterized membrane protein
VQTLRSTTTTLRRATLIALAAALIFLGAGTLPADAASRFTSTPTPKISGTAQVGKKLTAKPGSWKPSKGVKLTFQWQRNGTKIKGATKKTYTLKTADKGKKITVKVTATKKPPRFAGWSR